MPQTITNNAQIEYQYEASNGTVSLETQTNYVTTNISQNHINILKTSNKDHFGPKEKITYNLFISNNSSSTIFNVEILESLSEFTNYIKNSSTITLSDGISSPIKEIDNTNSAEGENLPIVGNIISSESESFNNFGFKLKNIAPNETVLISFSTDINEKDDLPESISNNATLYYSRDPENKIKLSVKSNTNIINKAFAQLVATKSVDKTSAISGDTLTYTISINNQGNINANNVHIIDKLPSNFEVLSVDLVIADLPYKMGYRIDEDNTLTIPASENEQGFCIPANSDDNTITIRGTINF